MLRLRLMAMMREKKGKSSVADLLRYLEHNLKNGAPDVVLAREDMETLSKFLRKALFSL